MSRLVRVLSINLATMLKLTQCPTATCRAHRLASIISHRADGLSQAGTVLRFGVSRPVAIKWERHFRASG